MRVQHALGIDKLTFGRAGAASDVQRARLGADRACLVGQRPHEVDLDLQRGVAGACRQMGLHGAAHAAVEQSRSQAAMHDADRVVVPELGRHLEARVALRDLGETKAQQCGDRRRRQTTVRDAAQELEAAHRLHGLKRRHADVVAELSHADLPRCSITRRGASRREPRRAPPDPMRSRAAARWCT